MARVFTHSTSVCLAALTLGLAACGGDSSPAGSAPSTTATEGPTATSTTGATTTPTPPTATAPSAASPPPDAPTPTPTPTPTAGGESQPGGGGDEAAARVPVAITIGSDGTVSPRQVNVPSFFALQLRVHNRTASALKVRWSASEPTGEFRVPAGGTVTRRVAGVKRGIYRVEIPGVGIVTVISGSEPGP